MALQIIPTKLTQDQRRMAQPMFNLVKENLPKVNLYRLNVKRLRTFV